MKFSICQRWSAALLVLLCTAFRAECQTAPLMDPITPADPKMVLSALPAAPSDWKLVRSEAKNQYADWQFTVATREYLQNPVPPGNLKAGEKPPEPGKVLIMVTDSGFWPQKGAAFNNFEPGKKGNIEKLMIGNYPALIMSREDSPEGRTSDLLLLWVENRYLVAVESTGLPKDLNRDWASRVNFAFLKSIPADGQKVLPNPLIMTTVDELVPSNNRTGRYVWTPIPHSTSNP